MSEINLSQLWPGDDEPLNEETVRAFMEDWRRGRPLPSPVLMRTRDGRYRVVDGRCRVEAARRCGAETVAAYVIEELSPEKFRELRQALNAGRKRN
jgi:hypothetical protein